MKTLSEKKILPCENPNCKLHKNCGKKTLSNDIMYTVVGNIINVVDIKQFIKEIKENILEDMRSGYIDEEVCPLIEMIDNLAGKELIE